MFLFQEIFGGEDSTAELVVVNTSSQEMKGWSYSFDSPHQLSSEVWGASLEQQVLPSGLTRYTLRGIDWAEDIPAGGTVTVGFNGIQGPDLGRSGGLTKAMLMDAGYTPMASDHVIVDYQDHGHELENNSVFSDHIDITSWEHFMGRITTLSTTSWWAVERQSQQRH